MKQGVVQESSIFVCYGATTDEREKDVEGVG